MISAGASRANAPGVSVVLAQTAGDVMQGYDELAVADVNAWRVTGQQTALRPFKRVCGRWRDCQQRRRPPANWATAAMPRMDGDCSYSKPV